jgi:hypothetical protein
MFWPVLRRCHTLKWDWSVLPLAHHSIFPFKKFGVWFLYVSTILWLLHILQDLYSACLMFWMRTHTGPRFIVSSEGRESYQPQVIGRLTQTRFLFWFCYCFTHTVTESY